MLRTVNRVLLAQDIIDNGEMHLRRALPQDRQTSLGPFVFIDHYRHDGLHGIGDRPHPHAGIEVVSYLLEGSVEHRDSMGFRDRLNAGDAQFIRSGRGMLHAEQPLSGRHGLQLWTSLPPELKLVEPSYTSIRAQDIPAIHEAGATLKVLANEVNGVHGPMALSGEAVFAQLQLKPDASMTITTDPTLELGVYVLQGNIEIDGVTLATGALAILNNGDSVKIAAHGEDTVELAMLGGAPVKGEVIFAGPFVMDTQARISQAKRDFVSGRMGQLEGVPF